VCSASGLRAGRLASADHASDLLRAKCRNRPVRKALLKASRILPGQRPEAAEHGKAQIIRNEDQKRPARRPAAGMYERPE
jgi:hypothetical protein